MPRFRATFVEPSGTPRVVRMEGASAADVMSVLERRGARNVSVLEDFLSREGRNLDAEESSAERLAAPGAPFAGTPGPSPTEVGSFIEQRLAWPAPKPRPTPATAARGWLLQVAVFAGVAWLKRPAANAVGDWGFKAAVGATVATLILGAVAVAPLWLDWQTRHARAWRNWPAVLRFTALAGWLPSIRSRPALRYAYGTLRAAALAGTGQLDAALALVERVARDNQMSQSLVDNAKAGVYLAINRYDEGIAFRRRVAADPARRGSRVDLAIALLEYRYDVAGAREQLAALTTPPTSLIEAGFRSLALGLLDIEEGRPEAAVLALTRARSAFEREAAASSLEGILLWSGPFLCVALARAGRREEAAAMLPRVTQYLEATAQSAWLDRCRQALATPSNE